jgi:hypothetical protein
LRERQRTLGGKAEAAVRFALQAGQVVQEGRGLGGGLGFLGGDAGLAGAGCGDGRCALLVPDPFGLALAVLVLLEFRVEPAARILASLGAEASEHFPIVPSLEGANPLFALEQDRERRGLHPPDCGEVEAALLRIEGGHGAGAVDAHQPIGFRT